MSSRLADQKRIVISRVNGSSPIDSQLLLNVGLRQRLDARLNEPTQIAIKLDRHLALAFRIDNRAILFFPQKVEDFFELQRIIHGHGVS